MNHVTKKNKLKIDAMVALALVVAQVCMHLHEGFDLVPHCASGGDTASANLYEQACAAAVQARYLGG